MRFIAPGYCWCAGKSLICPEFSHRYRDQSRKFDEKLDSGPELSLLVRAYDKRPRNSVENFTTRRDL
jgi:hypothetical protein